MSAVHVTVVVPMLNVLPEAGEQFTFAAGVPVDAGVAKVTTGLQVMISDGHAPMTGLSLIFTLNEHDEVPHALVAVHVTTVVPAVKVDPDNGEQTTVGVVPVAVGSVHVAIALSHCSISDGHALMTGAVQPPMRLTLKSRICPWLEPQ